MKIVNLYVCELCQTAHLTEESAKNCEELPNKEITLPYSEEVNYVAWSSQNKDGVLMNYAEKGKLIKKVYLRNKDREFHQEGLLVSTKIGETEVERIVIQDYNNDILISTDDLIIMPGSYDELIRF